MVGDGGRLPGVCGRSPTRTTTASATSPASAVACRTSPRSASTRSGSPRATLAASRSRVRHRRLLRHRARLRRPRRVRRACPGGPSERHPDHDGRGPQPLQLRPRLVPRGRDGWARVGGERFYFATVEAPQGTSRRTTGRRSSAARPGPGSTSRTDPWAVVPRTVHTWTAGLRLEPPRCRRPLRPHAALLARPRRRRLPRRLGDGRRQGTWSPRPRVAPKRRSIGAGARTRTSSSGPKAMRCGATGAAWSTPTRRSIPGGRWCWWPRAYTPRRPDLMSQYANEEEFHQSFASTSSSPRGTPRHTAAATNATVEALMPAGLLPAGRSTTTTPSVRSPGSGGPTPRSTAPRSRVLDSSHAAVDTVTGTRRARAAALFVLGLPGCVYSMPARSSASQRCLTCRTRPARTPFVRSGGAELSARWLPACLCGPTTPARRSGSRRGHVGSRLPQPSEWARWNAAGQEVIDRCSRFASGARGRRATPDRRQPASRCCSRTIRTWCVPAWRDRRRAQHVGQRALFQTDSSTVRALGISATQASRHRRAGFGRVVRSREPWASTPAVS